MRTTQDATLLGNPSYVKAEFYAESKNKSKGVICKLLLSGDLTCMPPGTCGCISGWLPTDICPASPVASDIFPTMLAAVAAC